MKSVSASHLHYTRWNSLLPKGLAKLWILNFNISMNIMNCFNTNKVFPSVSSNFLEFRMFWHVPFQELQVSKRNRHFEQNFQLSQHLFPVPFFPLRSGCPWRIVLLRLPWRLWASLLECDHPWDAWQHPNNIQTTSTSNIEPQKKTPPTVKSTSVSRVKATCSATLEILEFLSQKYEFWVIFSRSVHCCFRDFDELWSHNGFQIDKSPGMGWFNPKNGLFNGESHGYLSYLTLAIPMLFVGPILPHRQTALFGMEIIWYHQASTLCFVGWIPI